MSSKQTEYDRQVADVFAAHEGDAANGATTLPVWNSTAFRYNSAEDMEKVFAGQSPGFVYSRISNPTLFQFERRVCALEKGAAAISFSSGMAAISSTILGLAGTGDEVVAASGIFGGTYSLFANLLPRLGIKTVFVDSCDKAAVGAAVSSRTRAVFVETMGNPSLRVPDIAGLAEITKKLGVALVVDNTVTTPVLFRPVEHGADIVVESTSKYINGCGTVLGGIMVDSGRMDWNTGRYSHFGECAKFGAMAFSAYMRQSVAKDMGACFNPQSAYAMSVGLDTLEVRMERHCANALAVAEAVRAAGAVPVNYPGLPEHLDHVLAGSQFGARYGGILSLRLGSRKKAMAFINSLKSAMIAANIGDARTLVIHPASTFCREFDQDKKASMGVYDDLVRLSIGLESTDAIVADICGALEKVIND